LPHLASVFTGTQRVQLIGKICVQLSPEHVINENFVVTSVFSISVTPPRFAPDLWFPGGAFTHTPFVEVWQHSKALHSVVLGLKLTRRHFEPPQPLGTPEHIDEVIGGVRDSETVTTA
jgi:hypothetical protein